MFNVSTTQAWNDDRKHGRDRSAAERRPSPACLLGRDACDQFSSAKDILHIFSTLVFMTVSNTSSCSFQLKHGALRSRYMSLGIERQFFNMKNAWCGSISSRFSMMLTSILVLPLDVVRWNPDAEGILITAIDWEQGLRWMGIHPGKA